MPNYSQGYTPARLVDELNRSMPSAMRAMLGQTIADLIAAVNAMLTALSAVILTKATLAIKAGSSPIVKATNAYNAVINGVLISVAASDMSALAGTLATAKSAAWAFYVDGTGTITTSAKTADSATAAAAAALLPAPPAGLAQIGFIVVTNATGANFVGATTALDTGSLTVVYNDTVGPVLPAAILSVGALGTR